MTDAASELLCWHCGATLVAQPLPIGRHDQCQQCSEFLHCCHFCLHFDVSAIDQCKEALNEVPNNKSNGNFCEYFSHNVDAYSKQQDSSSGKSASAASKFDALFDDQIGIEETKKTKQTNNPLDGLFDDLSD